MKLKSCLMIRCIALNTINTQKLFSELEYYAKKHFANASIALISNEPYWKYPECNDIIYNLSNDEFITVSDFTKHFSISWIYTKGDAYSIDLKRDISTEDAIWNQTCHPTETFLMSEIEWVNIYSWEENE